MSHSQFHSTMLFILRHAWLNLWDKRMTTGRINQVNIFESFSQLQTYAQHKRPLQHEDPSALSNAIFTSSGQSHTRSSFMLSRSNETTHLTHSNATHSHKVSFVTQIASFNFILQNWENPQKLHAQLDTDMRTYFINCNAIKLMHPANQCKFTSRNSKVFNARDNTFIRVSNAQCNTKHQRDRYSYANAYDYKLILHVACKRYQSLWHILAYFNCPNPHIKTWRNHPLKRSLQDHKLPHLDHRTLETFLHLKLLVQRNSLRLKLNLINKNEVLRPKRRRAFRKNEIQHSYNTYSTTHYRHCLQYSLLVVYRVVLLLSDSYFTEIRQCILSNQNCVH